MQIIRDDKHPYMVKVRFTNEEYKAIRREVTDTQCLELDVIKSVLERGFRVVGKTLYCKVKDRG